MTIKIEELRDMDFSDVADLSAGRAAYPHPGQILKDEFLKPLGITQYRLAKEIGVPQRRIGEIVSGKRAVTVDTGLRLSAFFGMSESFWSDLQTDYDTAIALDALSEMLARIPHYTQVQKAA